MAARQESKVTRLDLRIPNDIYTQVEEIAKINNEPTHHITGKIILTPTLVKLIRLGIRSLSGNYPALADIPTSSGQVSDMLVSRMDANALAHRLSVVEQEFLDLKKLVSRLSDTKSDIVSDKLMIDLNNSEPPGVIDSQPDVLADIQPDNIKLADSLPDIISDTISSDSLPSIATQSPPSEPETMSWTEFYRTIDEILPPDLKRNKANSDNAIALAVSKGFDGWRYDSRVKNFIKL